MSRDALFWHFPIYVGRQTPGGAIRQGDFKLIESFEDGRLELYDLRNDIGERNDLAAAMPEKVDHMRGRLAQWRRSLTAPVPTELNSIYDPDARDGRRGAGGLQRRC